MRSIFGKHTQPTKQELEIMWALITHNNGNRVFHKLIGYMTQRKHNRERWLQALTHAVCPIQLVNGCADPISGGHMVARFEELVSSKHIVKLHDIGHYPQIEAPKEIAQAIISFINNN
jgi:pimeloyl-ACP methyl ester carboxylesterase